jgi:hypothetical protein
VEGQLIPLAALHAAIDRELPQPDGVSDEVILGDLAKLGVKLVFHMQAAAESKEAIDRTFIIDDFNQDEFNKFKE